MKLTKQQLKQIIKEELSGVVNEYDDNSHLPGYGGYNIPDAPSNNPDNPNYDPALDSTSISSSDGEQNLKAAVEELQSLLDYVGDTGMPPELEAVARELHANVAKAKAALNPMEE